MSSMRLQERFVAPLAATLIALLVGGIGTEVSASGLLTRVTSPQASAVIHGCYSVKHGVLHIAPAHRRCGRGERGISWNRTGPQGPAGAQGPAGPQGATGPQGPTGAVGPQGQPGLTGLTGAPGPAGPQGTTGARGDVGPQGPQGQTGPAGPAGAAGPAGPGGINGMKAYGAGTRTFAVPSGISHVYVEAWAAGGGGGGAGYDATTNWVSGGGAGGSGAYARAVLSVTPGDSLTITVGAGGTAGSINHSGPGGDGSQGGATEITDNGTVLLSVQGGNGGLTTQTDFSGIGAYVPGGAGGAAPSATIGEPGKKGTDGGAAHPLTTGGCDQQDFGVNISGNPGGVPFQGTMPDAGFGVGGIGAGIAYNGSGCTTATSTVDATPGKNGTDGYLIFQW